MNSEQCEKVVLGDSTTFGFLSLRVKAVEMHFQHRLEFLARIEELEKENER